jgi:hypothetical protein
VQEASHLGGGWNKHTALLFNLLLGLTFLLGGVVAYAASLRLDVRWLVGLLFALAGLGGS